MMYLWNSLTEWGQAVVSALILLILAALSLGWLYE